MQKIQFHNSNYFAEISDAWHKRWFASSITSWHKGPDAQPALQKCDDGPTMRPIVLAYYYTCVGKDSYLDGVYQRDYMPVIDAEDSQIVKDLTYVAIDREQYIGGLADKTEIHDIKDFLRPYHEGCRHCYCECWQEFDKNKDN